MPSGSFFITLASPSFKKFKNSLIPGVILANLTANLWQTGGESVNLIFDPRRTVNNLKVFNPVTMISVTIWPIGYIGE
jgi:hypothetical protein